MLRLGYKYKIYKLADDITICIRCQNHFYNPAGSAGQEGLSNLFVFLEWNQQRQGWTKDLDTNMNPKLNTEIIDNTCKLTRWTIQSIISGVETMRFAFVQRVNTSSSKSHQVIGFSTHNPQNFTGQLNLKMANSWAILKDVISTILAQDQTSADYLYMKDPNQANYKLYHMVNAENEDDDDDDEDDEQGL